MLNFLKKQKIAILGGVFAILSVFTVAIIVHAQTSQEFRGYGWSDNIGWVSFSCKDSNTCGDVNYGVTVDSSGNLSGYAWSNNIGWLDFNATGWPTGSGTTASSAKIVGNQLVGWAKFIGGTSSSGWDGWVSFTGTTPNYGVVINPPVSGVSTMTGFAWGSSVVGWMDMTQVTVGTPTAATSTMQLYASVNGSGNYAANTTIGPYPSGAIITLSWDLNNMLGGNGCMASGTWVGPKTSGSGTGTFVNAPIQYVNLGSTQVTKTFTLSCKLPDGVNSLSQTINMLLDPLTAGTPTVQLFTNSQPGGVTEPTVTVPSGPSNVSLSWSVHNVSPGWPPAPATSAPHCLAGDDWASSPPAVNIRPSNENTNNGTATDKHYANGMTVINNTSQPILKTYSIKCTRPSDGAVVSSLVTVRVLPAAGISSVTINAIPATIQPGQASTLTYTTNSVVAGSCAPTATTTAAGATQLSVADWTGATMVENDSDPQNVLVHAPGSINGELTTYTITCLGTDGATRQASTTVMIGEGSSPLILTANPGWVTTLNAPTALRWFNNTQTTLHACVSTTTDVNGNPLASPWNGNPTGLNVSNNYSLWTPLPGSTGPANPPPTPTIPVPVNATIFKIDCLDQMNVPVHAQVKVPVIQGALSVKLFTTADITNIHQNDQIPLLWNSPGSSNFASCQGTSTPNVYEWVGNPTPIMSSKVPNATNGYGIGAAGPFKMPINTPGWPANATIAAAAGTTQSFTITCTDLLGAQAKSTLNIRVKAAGALPLHIHATPGSITEPGALKTNIDWDSWYSGNLTGFDYKSCAASAEDVATGATVNISGWTDPMLSAGYVPQSPIYLATKSGVTVPGPYGTATRYIMHCSDNVSNPYSGNQAEASVIVQTIPESAGVNPDVEMCGQGYSSLGNGGLGDCDSSQAAPVQSNVLGQVHLRWWPEDVSSCVAWSDPATGWSGSKAASAPNPYPTISGAPTDMVTIVSNTIFHIRCSEPGQTDVQDDVYVCKNLGGDICDDIWVPPSGGPKKPTFIECHGSDCANQ